MVSQQINAWQIRHKAESLYLSDLYKDTNPLYHTFMCSLVSLLSRIYPFLAKHSLVVTIIGTIYLIGINLTIYQGVHITYFKLYYFLHPSLLARSSIFVNHYSVIQ